MTVLCVSKLRVNVDDSELGGGILPTFFCRFLPHAVSLFDFLKKKKQAETECLVALLPLCEVLAAIAS